MDKVIHELWKPTRLAVKAFENAASDQGKEAQKLLLVDCLEKETKHAAQLKRMKEEFVVPLVAAQESGEFLPVSNVSRIFPHVVEIERLHSEHITSVLKDATDRALKCPVCKLDDTILWDVVGVLNDNIKSIETHYCAFAESMEDVAFQMAILKEKVKRSLPNSSGNDTSPVLGITNSDDAWTKVVGADGEKRRVSFTDEADETATAKSLNLISLLASVLPQLWSYNQLLTQLLSTTPDTRSPYHEIKKCHQQMSVVCERVKACLELSESTKPILAIMTHLKDTLKVPYNVTYSLDLTGRTVVGNFELTHSTKHTPIGLILFDNEPFVLVCGSQPAEVEGVASGFVLGSIPSRLSVSKSTPTCLELHGEDGDEIPPFETQTIKECTELFKTLVKLGVRDRSVPTTPPPQSPALTARTMDGFCTARPPPPPCLDFGYEPEEIEFTKHPSDSEIKSLALQTVDKLLKDIVNERNSCPAIIDSPAASRKSSPATSLHSAMSTNSPLAKMRQYLSPVLSRRGTSNTPGSAHAALSFSPGFIRRESQRRRESTTEMKKKRQARREQSDLRKREVKDLLAGFD